MFVICIVYKIIPLKMCRNMCHLFKYQILHSWQQLLLIVAVTLKAKYTRGCCVASKLLWFVHKELEVTAQRFDTGSAILWGCAFSPSKILTFLCSLHFYSIAFLLFLSVLHISSFRPTLRWLTQAVAFRSCSARHWIYIALSSLCSLLLWITS
jgi:hypothetical protein